MNSTESLPKRQLGMMGEEVARQYLKRKGYRILATNFRFHRREIDIIAEYNHTVVFIEVKTRLSSCFGGPEESVTVRKQSRIEQTALAYLKRNGWIERCSRFDVIAVSFSQKGKPRINHIKDAF